MPKLSPFKKAETALRAHALAYPETREDFPWGERAWKVKKKVFVFLRATDEELGLSVKLPVSLEKALRLPFTEPTGYGLGKAGWVSAHFKKGEKPPMDLLKSWVDESYRAVAPPTVLKKLDGKK